MWEEKGFEIYAGPDYEKKAATNRLSAQELKALMDGKPGTFTLVDVRDAKEFAEGHIPGAISLPSDAFASSTSPAGPREGVPDLLARRASRSGTPP